MEIRRIVANIPSNKMEESKVFYRDFLGLDLAMDMKWIMTFVSPTNSSVQISIVLSESPVNSNPNIAITMEVSDVDEMHRRALEENFEITSPLKEEIWGVKRFFLVDPNGVTLNLMSHISAIE